MRMQASLEFLIILSVISLLSLSTIVLYKGNLASSNQLLSKILSKNALQGNASLSPSPTTPQVLIYLPQNSTLGKPNRMEIATFGCDNGSLSIAITSQSLYFPQNSMSFAVNGLSIVPLYFTPLLAGFGLINLSYNYGCNGAEQKRTLSLTTYSSDSTSQVSGASLSAYIGSRNETIIYGLVNDGKVESISEFGHCTYAGMFGPTGIGQQCGTANAWSYSVFSSYCYSTSNYYTATTCIVPTSTDYGLSSTDPSKYRLKYSFKLGLYYNSINLSSNLSNNSSSELFLGNNAVGSAEVESSFSPAPMLNSNFLSNNGNETVVNQFEYGQYLQAKNNLYNTLSFYNQSYVSSDIQSSIESAVSAYIKASNNLMNITGSQNSACSYSDSNYTCMASSPFSYQINATVNGITFGDGTVSYLGSTINLISK